MNPWGFRVARALGTARGTRVAHSRTHRRLITGGQHPGP